MQDNGGLKKILSMSWIYELFQNLVGAKSARVWLAENYWRLRGGEKVVDIGCGPGVAVEYLPENVEYVGIDISEKYITTAQRKIKGNFTFIVGTAGDFLKNPDRRIKFADLVLCNGLLHHLDDSESIEVLQLAKEIMKPTGRLVCIEPTFLVHQGKWSKWIIGNDRGRNVRGEQQWKQLVSSVFDSFSTNIATGLVRIPYCHIIIECRK